MAADDYMVDPAGGYCYDASRLGECHTACQGEVDRLLGYAVVVPAVVVARVVIARVVIRRVVVVGVVVANTFSQRWEMEPYFALAAKHGVPVHVVDMFDGGLTDEELAARNVHGIDAESIASMRARWEHDWKVGDPRPPWERG